MRNEQWRSHQEGQWGRVPPTVKNLPKSGKRGKNQEKEGKLGRKEKNPEGSFTLPLLTDRAGYATGNKNLHCEHASEH